MADDQAPMQAAERLLPHNLDIERGILAILLAGSNAIDIHKVRGVIGHPLAFFKRDHRILYMACLDLDDENHRVDASAVAELLSRMRFRVVLDRLRQQQQLMADDQLDGMSKERLRALYRFRPEDEASNPEDSALAAIGGYATVVQIANEFAPSSSLDRNAKLVWDYYLKRRYIQSLQSLADEAYMTTESFVDLVAKGSQTVLELSSQDKQGSVKNIIQVVDDTLISIGEAFNNPNTGVKTGFHDIDDKLMSLRPGGLYVLAARPGIGKTSFALNVVENIATQDDEGGILFFSLEVDATDLVKKLISSRAKVEFKKMEMGTCNEEEFQALSDAGTDISQWNLDLLDIADITVAQLRSHARRYKIEHQNQLKLVVIDYLQLLQSSRPSMTEYEKVSEISRTLKVIAKELGIPVLALSQVNRDSEKAAGKSRPPRLSDLRGSGSIEQDADAVIFLHHNMSEDDDGDKSDVNAKRSMQVIVAKNRFGPTDSVDMYFFPARQRFEQIAQEIIEDTYDVAKRPVVPRSDDEDLFDFPAKQE